MPLFQEYVLAGLAAVATYMVYVAVWRLYWSPLLSFLGHGWRHSRICTCPRMACLDFLSDTRSYEAYYNNWLGGKYIWKIDEMHKKYGPIVRISPSDLHVGDPVCALYSELVFLMLMDSRTFMMFSIPARRTGDGPTKSLG